MMPSYLCISIIKNGGSIILFSFWLSKFLKGAVEGNRGGRATCSWPDQLLNQIITGVVD
jgi:hypothetical protein